MPADVNPEGAAGPITASTPTTLTVATNSNLGEFSPGDSLVMVDESTGEKYARVVTSKGAAGAEMDWLVIDMSKELKS